MVSVSDYREFIKNKVVAIEMSNLDFCQTAADITQWRKSFNNGLKSLLVYGEQPDVAILNPQDDRSDLPMPQRLAAEFQDLIDTEHETNHNIREKLKFIEK